MKKGSSKPKQSSRGFHVVALGGGTGLSTLLRGLKGPTSYAAAMNIPIEHHPIAELTAIVTVTDDGGSSGRLRRENRILASRRYSQLHGGPLEGRGTARAAVSVSLSRGARSHRTQFRQPVSRRADPRHRRFRGSGSRQQQRSSRFAGASFRRRFPTFSWSPRWPNGRSVHGETRITASHAAHREALSVAAPVAPIAHGIEAIEEADLILLGPGSLYTSILPNLLIPEIAHAIAKSKAPRVYIANLMTQPGETSGYALADHLRAIRQHTSRRVIDWVVANRQPISPEVAKRYRARGAEPVAVDLTDLQKLGYRVVLDNLLDEHGVIRHNSGRLSQLLFEEFLSPRLS